MYTVESFKKLEKSGILASKLRQGSAKKYLNHSILDYQTEINEIMRAQLIGWLCQVQNEIELCDDTYALAVSILDAVICQHNIPRLKFQMYGVTSLYLASKITYMVPDYEIPDYVELTDNSCTPDQVKACEIRIFNLLSGHLNIPTVRQALHMIHKFTELKDLDRCYYIADLLTISTEYTLYLPSVLATTICQGYLLHGNPGFPTCKRNECAICNGCQCNECRRNESTKDNHSNDYRDGKRREILNIFEIPKPILEHCKAWLQEYLHRITTSELSHLIKKKHGIDTDITFPPGNVQVTMKLNELLDYTPPVYEVPIINKPIAKLYDTKTLGRGSHSIVKKMITLTTGSYCAYKRTLITFTDHGLYPDYVREIVFLNTMKIINPESVINIRSYSISKRPKLFMDAGSCSLRRYISRNDFGKYRLCFTDQLCRGLYAIHCAGLIHRNISPENIIVIKDSECPKLKYTDFGISSMHWTNDYIPGDVYDDRLDIWDLGCVLYELWTLKRIKNEELCTKALDKWQETDGTKGTVPLLIKIIIDKCLSADERPHMYEIMGLVN
jgi:hypothetical protein